MLRDDDAFTAKLLCKTLACLACSGSFAIDNSPGTDRMGLVGVMELLRGVVEAGRYGALTEMDDDGLLVDVDVDDDDDDDDMARALS